MTIDYQKAWNTMNELEMVTSKICSAREILDSAVDRLQEHQYDKAETLLYAADEFLQYYLEDFDRKFKLAWKETVTKINQEETDDCMPSWEHSDLEYASKHPEENKVKSWVLPVDEDGVIILPEDLLEQTGWKEGDTLVYEISDGGVIVRRKDLRTDDEMVDAGYTITADGFWIMNMDAC